MFSYSACGGCCCTAVKIIWCVKPKMFTVWSITKKSLPAPNVDEHRIWSESCFIFLQKNFKPREKFNEHQYALYLDSLIVNDFATFAVCVFKYTHTYTHVFAEPFENLLYTSWHFTPKYLSIYFLHLKALSFTSPQFHLHT